MAFTSEEESCLRYYLGRSDYAIPSPSNGWDQLNAALTLLSPEGETRIRGYLTKLEAVEEKLSSLDCLKLEEIDGGTKFFHPGPLRLIYKGEGRRLVMAIARFMNVKVVTTPFDVHRTTMTMRG